MSLCLRQVLQCAYDTRLIGMHAKSSKWKKSRRQVGRHQRSAAFGYMLSQFLTLHNIVQSVMKMTSMDQMGITAVDELACDETKQRLRMSLGRGLLPSQTIHAPHVFVSRRSLRLRFDSSRILCMKWMALPIAMLSTSAGALQSVLHVLCGIASHRTFNMHVAQLLPFIRQLLKLRTMDGASGNKRYSHWEFLTDEPNPKVLGVAKHCHMHSTSLGLGSTTNTCFRSLAEELYVGARWFMMGGFWLRMLYQVPLLCQTMVKPTFTPQDPFWANVCDGLIRMLVLAHVAGQYFSASVDKN